MPISRPKRTIFVSISRLVCLICLVVLSFHRFKVSVHVRLGSSANLSVCLICSPLKLQIPPQPPFQMQISLNPAKDPFPDNHCDGWEGCALKFKLLDLYCGAGGCSVGYHRAGFEVVGVDIEPQPNYPFEFIQMDAIEFLKTQDLSEFHVIHASPPCQKFSRVQHLGKARNGSYKEHPDLLTPTRELLKATGKPYVIENVMGAPLINPIVLCGSMFKGLKVYRHRQFESNVPLYAPEHRPHNDKTPSAGNGPSPKGFISVCGTGGVRGMNSKQILEYWSMAMGIDWMTRRELAQAIPPAYTEWVGRQLIMQLELLAYDLIKN